MINNHWNKKLLRLKEIWTYPKLADAVLVRSGAGMWLEGKWVEIIPANVVKVDFFIIGVWWAFSIYENILEIGKGAVGSEIEIINIPGKRKRITESGYIPFTPIFFPPIRLVRNTRVSVRTADSYTGSTDHFVKVICAA